MPFCIALEANIKPTVCPLPKGKCYWQHRLTKECCYTETDMSTQEYCLLVHAKQPTETETEAFKKELRKKL